MGVQAQLLLLVVVVVVVVLAEMQHQGLAEMPETAMVLVFLGRLFIMLAVVLAVPLVLEALVHKEAQQ
jgi:hypothetical protein